MLQYNNIVFDDFEINDKGYKWSRICRNCVNKHNINNNDLDDGGSGKCSVLGCNNEADYYIDFYKK